MNYCINSDRLTDSPLKQLFYIISCIIQTAMEERARILVRVRPMLEHEDEPAWIIKNNSIRSLHSKAVANKHSRSLENMDSHRFHFDRVLEHPASSQKIYKAEVRAVVQKSMLSSVDTTIVAYGQTCSGKTYTLLGVKQAPGFIPCVLRDIFAMQGQEGYRYNFKLSYIQIYNENLSDLLQKKDKKMKIVKGDQWGCDVEGAVKLTVRSFEECLIALDTGEEKRKYAAKGHHDHSSRSHTILRIHIERRDSNFAVIRSTVNIVDLAGSERLGGEKGSAETGYINKSLFHFSNVISKLSEPTLQHIPYRDSKLTRLLESSLTSNSYVVVVFCVSPALLNISQSISTLRLAEKARNLQLNIEQHDIPSYQATNQEMMRLRNIIKQQEKQISKSKKIIEELTQQVANSEPNQAKLSIKGTILFDYENFVLDLQGRLINGNDRKLDSLVNTFKEELRQVYSSFAKRISRFLLNQAGLSKCEVDIEKMCLTSLLTNKNQMGNWKAQAIRKLMSSLPSQSKQRCLLSQYLSRVHHDQPLTQKQSPVAVSKKAKQIPILGETLLAWGCKKDCRVFLAQKTDACGVRETNSLGNIVSVISGVHHTLAFTQKGELFGWGKNEKGQVDSTCGATVEVPRSIYIKDKVKSVAAGWSHSLCATQQGQVFSWGQGQDGQLGQGLETILALPTLIASFQKCHITSVYAGHSHSGFIDSQGNYYACGFNGDYRLMIAEDKVVNEPLMVKLKGIRKAALGVNHSCLLTKEGKVYCGGVGSNGELGMPLDPTVTGYETIEVASKNGQASHEKVCPIIEVQAFSKHKCRAIDISCGENMTAIVNCEGNLYTFGKTSYHRLGHEETGITKIISGVDRVQLGYRHGFAWKEGEKQLYGWGFNMYNQLGTLKANDAPKPVLIDSVSGKTIVSIAAGFFHSAAVTTHA